MTTEETPPETRRPFAKSLPYFVPLLLIILVVAAVWLACVWQPLRPPSARGRRVRADIVNLEKAVSAYAIDRDGRFPATLQELVHTATNQDGLLSEVPNDPWGTPYLYSVEGVRPFIRSAGPDRVFDTPDDVSSRTIRESRQSR